MKSHVFSSVPVSFKMLQNVWRMKSQWNQVTLSCILFQQSLVNLWLNTSARIVLYAFSVSNVSVTFFILKMSFHDNFFFLNLVCQVENWCYIISATENPCFDYCIIFHFFIIKKTWRGLGNKNWSFCFFLIEQELQLKRLLFQQDMIFFPWKKFS